MLRASRLMSPVAVLALTLVASFAQARVVLVTTDFILEPKLEAIEQAAASYGLEVAALRAGQHSEEQLEASLDGAQWLLLDAPRGNDMVRIQQAFGDQLAAWQGPQLHVIGDQFQARALDQAHAEALATYYRNGTLPNFKSLFAYWSANITGDRQIAVPEPVEFPDYGIYHPELEGLVLDSPSAYLEWLASRDQHPDQVSAVIGVVISGNDIGAEQTGMIDALIERIEALGAAAWVFYYPSQAPDGLTRMASLNEQAQVDVIINTTHMFGVQDRPRELEALNVPLIQSFGYRDGTEADWRADPSGLPQRALPAFLAVPEQMGAQDPLVIAAHDGHSMQLMEAQADAMLKRAIATAQLRRTAPEDRQLALMYWSYPPGERGVSASNLNVPRSLARLTGALAEKGYAVAATETDQLEARLPELLDPWLGRHSASDWQARNDDWDVLPLSTYHAWLQSLPTTVQERLQDALGAPEQSDMVVEQDVEPGFLIPRLQLGGLTLLPQPQRGQSAYHGSDAPPSHAYLATYLYVREQLGADALIHFGTHGSQEFLPGKERSLAAHDDALLVLGNLPVIYPYISDNIGEGLQARRRGRAVTVTHQPPPFAPAGLSGKLYQVHELIHDWEMLDPGPVRARTEDEVIALVLSESLYRDLGWEEADMRQDFVAFEKDLHDYLHELAADTQPLGLHEFGAAPDPKHRLTTIMQMLGEPFYDALALDEPEELFVDDYQTLAESEPYQFLARFLLNGESSATIADEDLKAFAEQALEWDEQLQASAELASLLNALEGGFVPPTPGGDTIRNPDILPTGRNLFGFDPARLPTPRAWEVGRELAEDLIAEHKQRHGDYPASLAVSLWSSEAMRHQGVVEAQVLALLGLEPEWDRAGRLSGLRVMDTGELGRPRVDVVTSITGVYRDQFPHFIEQLSRGVLALSESNGDDNAVARHSQALANRLQEGGVAPEKAARLAALRVFSSPSGNYGTGVPGNLFDTEGWETDDELAADYLARMQYGYGPDDLWGVRLDDFNLYAEHLQSVEGAVLSRSSNLHGLLSTDHPFEYLGGIAMAVRSLTGSTPDLYVSDLRNPASGRNLSAARFLAGELRSRYQHPGWIEAMQAEGYAGTLELQNIVNNFFGWQVVDPAMTRDDQWDSFHSIYVEDALDLGLEEWFAEHNPEALTGIIERMLEAARRDYWQASEAVLQDLVERHQQLADTTARTNGQLGEYIENLATGFGLSAPGGTDASAEGGAQPVTGQLLQEVPAPGQAATTALDLRDWLIGLALLGLVLLGASRQWLRLRQVEARMA